MMAAAAKIRSGKISAESLKTALMEKYGINIDSDPALAFPFYNILNLFSLLDSPHSSPSNKSPTGKATGSGKGEAEEVWTEHTSNINDGFCWSKYGQKTIQKSPYQRSYFKCLYAKQEDCKAKRKVQQIGDSPDFFEIIYSSRHTCHLAANNDTHGHGSRSMIEFYPQVPSLTDLDLPPLVTVDHQEPLRNHDDDDESWLNSTIPGNDMKGEDKDEFLVKIDEPVWSPCLDMVTFFDDDFDLTF